MASDERYAILFEPVAIGPVVAKNRFYQVPHCCGFGHLRPQAHAAMRAVKAEGGWAVVSTEEAEIHPSSDLSPYSEQRIWDQRDVPALRLMTDAVHEHGSLAAVELVHNGHHAPNLYSRTPPLAPSAMTIDALYPKQARAMTKRDLHDLRSWHRNAVRHAKQAGFDIVYVYAGHYMSIAHHFLSSRLNQRSDEYGGSLENRARLTRELLEDALDEAAGDCAIAFRFAVDDLSGKDGMQAEEEGRAIVEMFAELPDLWDVNVAGWENDSQTARFAPEQGYQDEYTHFVKALTTKPVVGVGRYTSADHMVSLVRQGKLDLIGAARPSIADPFLPNKIRDGRSDEICECIGCNICVSSDSLGVPIRCTQNPTMGEEWRRGWHPQHYVSSASNDRVLIVGAGPAGLECAFHLSKRGYPVTLAEARRQLGGRAHAESQLKGLASWSRVCDYREYALTRHANVELYRDSELSVPDIVEFDAPQVIIATGARWRRDGVGRSARSPIPGLESLRIMTPDDIMAGGVIDDGPVVVYDDDQAYIAGVIADHISDHHGDVSFVTPAAVVSPWTQYTLEQKRVQSSLIHKGVAILANQKISAADAGEIELSCIFSNNKSVTPCTTLILVTERVSVDHLYRELQSQRASYDRDPIASVALIGDALSPGLIADAVFSGHLTARNLQANPDDIDTALYRREMPHV